jgi:hypothetical protein
MKMPQIANKETILKKKNEQRHEVQVDPENPDSVMEVWVRDITFLDVQNAAQRMFLIVQGEATLDLAAYWEYAFSNWIVRTNPELDVQELLELNAFIGEQIASLLPKPDEMAEAMQGGFTKANS